MRRGRTYLAENTLDAHTMIKLRYRNTDTLLDILLDGGGTLTANSKYYDTRIISQALLALPVDRRHLLFLSNTSAAFSRSYYWPFSKPLY